MTLVDAVRENGRAVCVCCPLCGVGGVLVLCVMRGMRRLSTRFVRHCFAGGPQKPPGCLPLPTKRTHDGQTRTHWLSTKQHLRASGRVGGGETRVNELKGRHQMGHVPRGWCVVLVGVGGESRLLESDEVEATPRDIWRFTHPLVSHPMHWPATHAHGIFPSTLPYRVARCCARRRARTVCRSHHLGS